MKRMGFVLGMLGLAGTLIAAPFQRVVTAGGTVTEIVFALGRGDKVVGVDSSSLFPAQALASLPQVGYVRQLSAEGLLSLAPDLILTTADAGPPAVLNQVEGAGTPVVRVPPGSSWEAAKERIRFVADLLSAPEAGRKLISRLDQAERRVAARTGSPDRKPARVLFVYARGAGALMVSGTGTEADAMIRLAGGVNAVTQYQGYRPLTPEAVAAARPDLLLFTTLGLQSLGGLQGLASLPALAGTSLAQGEVAHLDDLLLLGFGPRLGEAVEALEALLPPGR